jgi:hypothetical protein
LRSIWFILLLASESLEPSRKSTLCLIALARAGFFYKTNKTLYPCWDNSKRFNLYLNFVNCPALLEVKNE